MAGYSGRPLPQKLGIKEGHRVALVDAPAGFARTLGVLPYGVRVDADLGRPGAFDVVVWFVKDHATLEKDFAKTARRLHPAGGLWIGWPKRASGVATDVTENIVRGIALAHRLVDNKVCAIDEVWSGLRCVVRLKDRPAGAPIAKERQTKPRPKAAR